MSRWLSADSKNGIIAQQLDIRGEHVLDDGWGSLLLFWPNVFPAELG